MYDKNNVFAKIIRGEISCDAVIENEHAVSFWDINPACKTHVLVIPKGEYENILDFTANANLDEQIAFWDCFTQTAQKLGVEQNFNVLANAGADAPLVQQSVFHFHLHLLSGPRTPSYTDVLG